MMDRLLTAGLCGNTIGQDIQTLIYHSSTSNMAFHLKDVCSSVADPVRMMANTLLMFHEVLLAFLFYSRNHRKS